MSHYTTALYRALPDGLLFSFQPDALPDALPQAAISRFHPSGLSLIDFPCVLFLFIALSFYITTKNSHPQRDGSSVLPPIFTDASPHRPHQVQGMNHYTIALYRALPDGLLFSFQPDILPDALPPVFHVPFPPSGTLSDGFPCVLFLFIVLHN